MRRIIVAGLGGSTPREAARVLDATGSIVAVIPEPVDSPPVAAFRDAVVVAVAGAGLGDAIAGVAFAPRWGGGAVGLT